MRVLVINTFYYPDNVGGTERSLRLLCEGLYQNGHDVAVFCLANDRIRKEETINGVRVYRSSGGDYDVRFKLGESKICPQKIKNKLIEFNNRKCCRELMEIIEEYRPDIVNTNNLNGISTRAWKVVKQKGIPLVHTVRDYWLLSPTYTSRNLFIDRLYSLFHKGYAGKVKDVTGASSFIIDYFMKRRFFKHAEYHLIPNSLEIDTCSLKESIDERKERTGEIVFLFAGHLEKNKGVDLLLDVIAETDNNNLVFNFFGDGPLKDRIVTASSVDPRIRYYGKVSSSELTLQYRKADVVVVPSIWEEPFGRVVIEGFANGCTVVATEVGGMPEIIKTIHAGRICNCNKSELKNAIMYYSDRKNIVDDYPAIESNIYNYSLQTQIDSFVNLYNRIIEQP